jgi:hypothetical protein
MSLTAAVLLALSIASPAATSAQGAIEEHQRNEAVYQGLWCLYLHAAPYLTEPPADVACDYQPRPMTTEEAGSLYLRLAQDSNALGYRWTCADKKSKKGLPWRQDRKWAGRVTKLSQQHDRRVRAVTWPEDVRKKVTKYLDLGASEDFARKRVYTHKTLTSAVLSGDWKAFLKANDKRAHVSQQLRKSIRLAGVPDPPNACKAAKRYEALRQTAPSFDNPFEHPDIRRVGARLAGLGSIETRQNEAGEPALYLTDDRLAAARSIPAIGENATPEEVLAGLFTPIETPTPEPSPSPESVELTLPEG